MPLIAYSWKLFLRVNYFQKKIFLFTNKLRHLKQFTVTNNKFNSIELCV